MQITRGKQPGAQKVVLYGPEGIGKSTFASRFPEPVFIDTEGSTRHLDVARLPKPSSWTMLLDDVKYIRDTPGVCKTLIIDTLDWAEALCTQHVCDTAQKKGVEDFGYGKGYVYVAEEFGKLLNLLDEVIDRGINVLGTAHAKMRKFEQPDEQGAYDRWEMKLSKQVAPLLKEWCDMLLFLNYKTYVVTTETNAKKAQGGKRVIYTSHHPCWDAKNRHSLPDEMDLDFKNIAHLFKTGSEPAADAVKPIARLRSLMAEANVTDAELQKVVADKGHYAADAPIDTYSEKFISGWLIKYWPQILNLINADRTVLD